MGQTGLNLEVEEPSTNIGGQDVKERVKNQPARLAAVVLFYSDYCERVASCWSLQPFLAS